MKRKPVRIIVLALAAAFVLAGIVFLRCYYGYIQYLEIGYRYGQVYITKLLAQTAFQCMSLAAVFAVFAANALVLRSVALAENNDLKIIKSKRLLLLLVFIVSFIASRIVSEKLYETFLTFRNVTWFEETDPIFGWDLGYYIFTRPFFIALVEAAKGLLLFNIAAVLLIYVLLQLRGGAGELKKLFKNKGVFTHCFVNLMLFVILTALAYKFNIESLLYSSFSSVTGAGAADMNVWYLYYKIAPFLLIVIVPASIYFLMKSKPKPAAASLAVFPAVWIAAVICAVVYQTIFIDTNELTRENRYLSYHIDMTRKAYGLDKISEEPYEIKNDLTVKDLSLYSETLENAPLTSEETILQNIAAQQSQGDYESFTNADIGVYSFDGERIPVAIAAREPDSGTISKSADAYANAAFKYTHGTGIAMAQMNKFDSKGNAALRIKDTPPISDFGMTQVSEPRIYYGETTDATAFVRTGYIEYDYENNQNGGSYAYSGFGGIQMTLLNRAAMAVGGGGVRQLFSQHIASDSRALVNRNIIERVSMVAPFFMYDGDPYLVLTDDGQMKWIVDAYAVTDQYPYSERMGGINYIRSCAKVVVDAYSGSVDFYAVDAENPFVQTYSKMYPDLFSREEMPSDIKSHLRYPRDLFTIQAQMYQKYHVTDTGEFYNATREWETAKTKTLLTPYYAMLQTENGARMSLVNVYTTRRAGGVCALLSAGSDEDNYGEITANIIYESDDNSAYSPAQAENIMNSDGAAEAIKELSQNGATVMRGAVTIVPVKNTLVYAQTVYTSAEADGKSPRYRGVAAAYNGRSAFGATLNEALRRMLADGKKNENIYAGAKTDDPGNEADLPLVNRAVEIYKRVQEYSRAGDWENYGKAMKEFDDVMSMLDAQISIEGFIGPVIDND